MNLNNLGSNIALRNVKLAPKSESVLKKLTGIYEEKAKLVFMFDVSGSMISHIAVDKSGQSLTANYVWPADTITKVRDRVMSVMARQNALSGMPLTGEEGPDIGEPLSQDDVKYFKLFDMPTSAAQVAMRATGEIFATFTPEDDEDVKQRLIRANLLGDLGVYPDYTKPCWHSPTRLELVRKLGANEIAHRFTKYPDAKIAVVKFAGRTEVPFDEGTHEQVVPIMQSLDFGCDDSSTDILKALRTGLEVCRKRPSEVGMHHFILVTDGGDYAANHAIGEWVPVLRASGVVLDYIHIGEESHVNEGIKAAAEALGGIYANVNTEAEFETRFVEAARRPMLPPPAVS